MTKDEKLEIIRQACIKANPEIVELKFGCEVEWNDGQKGLFIMENPLVGAKDEKGCHIRLFEGGGLVSPQSFSMENFERWFRILGRPIRLADVLLAMKPPHYGVNGWGEFLQLGHTYRPISTSLAWNLRADDLTQQSNECIDFLYDLLK